MTVIEKISLIVTTLVIIMAVGFVIYKEQSMAKQQAAINDSLVQMKQLADNITRSQSTYVSKDDLNAFAKQNQINMDVITHDLETLNATVTGINAITVSSTGSNQTNQASTTTTPNPNPQSTPTVTCDGSQIPCPSDDPFGYTKNEQHLTLNEAFGTTQVPVGDVGFSAWQATPWSSTIYPRNYNITNVLGTDQDGKHYVYNKVIINSNGKDYPVQISNSKYEEEVPSASFSWWSPKVYIGADVGVNVSAVPVKSEFAPNVSFGFLSYGTSKVNPDWSFGQVGLGYGTVAHDLQVQIAPANYNIGKQLPFMSNTYIGPVVGIGTNGNVMVGAGLRVGL